LTGKVALALGACIAFASCATRGIETWIAEHPIVLLGEVHDNARQHEQRLAAFEGLLARGARPALVMEQFDAHRQADIDRLRAQGADAARIVAEAGGSGWHWPFYRPFVERALAHGLPLVAANVGRDEARRVMAEGLAARGFDADVPEDIVRAQAAQIEASHCGRVDATVARRMALAQMARDQSMARALEAHSMRGAVLLAGNGHVRTDVGVPRWLSAATRARTLSIGVVERGDATAAYDRRMVTPPQARPDPCAS
jgi:uncharacterized iron-regulated protein